MTQGIYVKRMPVEKLSLDSLAISRVEDMSRTAKFVVRDGAVRSILHAHLKAANKPPTKAYPPYPKVSPEGPEIRKVRVLSVQQTGLLVPVANGFADPANNHHISIYRLPDGQADFEVVSLYEASRRLAKREPVVRRQRGDGEFIMSLSSGDTVEFPDGEQKGLWIVQEIASKGQVTFSPINDARPTSEAESKKHGTDGIRAKFAPRVGGMVNRRARKVSIDPIGRIRAAGD
jgi:CRISPR-associated endonuclease Csn1